MEQKRLQLQAEQEKMTARKEAEARAAEKPPLLGALMYNGVHL